jgi:hypothetical protein
MSALSLRFAIGSILLLVTGVGLESRKEIIPTKIQCGSSVRTL